jgi:SGNH domain (fused to AT3 domains)
MRGRRSLLALLAILMVAGPGSGAAQDPPPVAASIRAALVAGDRGAPLPRHLVNEKGLKKDVWERWWTCTLRWHDDHGPICPLGDVRARRTVVVYGDSHVGVWLPALDRMGRQAGFRVDPLVKLGCGPFDVVQRHAGAPYPSCPRFRRWAERRIARIHPGLVILGYRGFWAVDPDPGESVAEAWQQGTRTAVRRLGRLTRRVVVLGDVPSKGLRPDECLARRGADMGTCTTPVEATVIQANRVTRRAATASGATFRVTQNLVCAKGRCPLVVDRIITYHDPSHLTMTWTQRISGELRARIRPLQR